MKPLLGAVAGLLAALALSTSALAHGVTAGEIEIIHPAIPAPAATAKSAAGYMAIANNGPTHDRLIAIETPAAASTMLHSTEHGADGVARMVHLPALEIPAEDTVVLEPGGMHVMLMGLTAPLTEGEMVPATLVFEQAGRVANEFMVDPPGGADHSTMDHSAMDHSTMDHAAPANSHAHAAGPMSTAAGSDADQITALLVAQFDRPDAPLTVAPVTILGNVAVAGWSQDGKGGRAFLRKDADGWFVEICAGESLVEPATFVSMGLTPAEAAQLAAAVNGAEASAGADLIARLNGFEGTVVVGRVPSTEAAPAHGHAHGAAPAN